MIYLWRVPENYPESLVGKLSGKPASVDRLTFIKSEPYDGISPEIVFSVHSKNLKNCDVLISDLGVPLVNDRLGNLIYKNAQNDVQLVSAKIICTDKEVGQYSVLNILSRVRAINKAKSKILYIPGTDSVMGFHELAHDHLAMGEHKIARDSEYLPHILVGDELASEFSTGRFSGVSLLLAEQIRW